MYWQQNNIKKITQNFEGTFCRIFRKFQPWLAIECIITHPLFQQNLLRNTFPFIFPIVIIKNGLLNRSNQASYKVNHNITNFYFKQVFENQAKRQRYETVYLMALVRELQFK